MGYLNFDRNCKSPVMKSYTAQILYRICCENISTEQFEEQWRLVFAEDDRSALEAVKLFAEKEECTFLDRHGRKITWQLVAVKDLQPVALENGAMLFSTVKEAEPVATPLWEYTFH